MPVLPKSNLNQTFQLTGYPIAAPVPMTQHRRNFPWCWLNWSFFSLANLQGATLLMDATILIDRQSGRSYHVEAPRAIIGHERSRRILRDPNVSRRHAEMTYDGAIGILLIRTPLAERLSSDIDVDEKG